MRAWVACVALVLSAALLIYFVVPRKHVERVLPAAAMDLIPSSEPPPIPFEPAGSMELDGVWIEDIMPRWQPEHEMLFFSHIPRTSGGTMGYILNATFHGFIHPDSSDGKPIGRFNQFRNTPPNLWGSVYKCLYTHEDFSFPHLIPYPVATAVFIRDPAENRRSIYDSQGVFRKWASGKYKTMQDWIGTKDYPTQYQVEWLAGATNYWPYSKATARYVEYMVRSPDELLRTAKENLARTAFLGITEQHNASVCLFHYSMRLPPKSEGKHWKSVHRISALKKSETLAEVQKPHLLLEYELYQFAVDLFNARLDWARRDLAVNGAQTAQFVGPECAGILEPEYAD